MTRLMQRMRSGLRRMGDWISGNDVTVTNEPPEAELLQRRPTRRPAVDIYESAEELLLIADVPGSLPDAAQVHVDGGHLTVLARVADTTKGRHLLGSGEVCDWYVAFTLPIEVEPERTEASLRDGVLTVRLPKQPRPASHRIAVTSS